MTRGSYLRWLLPPLAAGAILAILLAISNPRHTKESYLYGGVQLANQRQFPRAIELFDEALAQDPNCPEALLQRGSARCASGDPAGAIQDFDRAAGLTGDNAKAFAGRGIAWADLGDLDKAVADFTRALALGGDNPNTYACRAKAYELLQQFPAALADYSRALELEADKRNYVSRGVVYVQLQQYDQAVEDFTRAIELDDTYADAYNNRAVAYYRRGDFARAWQDVRATRAYGGTPGANLVGALSATTGSAKAQ